MTDQRDLLRAGFRSAAELARATVGTEVPVHTVNIRDLGHYTTNADPHALLGAATERHVPVIVDGAIRSLVSFVHGAGSMTWQVPTVGRAGLAQALDHASRTLAVAGHTALSLVVVPELRFHMVAYEDGSELMLMPLNKLAGTDLASGKTVTAAHAFAQLAQVAH
jgi:hypothetical protein